VGLEVQSRSFFTFAFAGVSGDLGVGVMSCVFSLDCRGLTSENLNEQNFIYVNTCTRKRRTRRASGVPGMNGKQVE